jgi:hypothetical protein
MNPFLVVEGVTASQTPLIVKPFKRLLKGVAQIIEIGFDQGGLSLWLHRNKRDSCSLVCYDITKERLTVPLSHGIDFRIGDCFSHEIITEIVELIQLPGRTLLLCDGGDKKKEFSFYCDVLKHGDIIMIHDYADNEEDYQAIKDKLNWPTQPEVFYRDIYHAAISHNLRPYNYCGMMEVLWGSFIK